MCNRSHVHSDSDPFDLKRFVDAQAAVYASVLDELRAGRKRSHWMWFVFPQLLGLGSSPMAALTTIVTELAIRSGFAGVLDPAFAASGPAFVAIVIGLTVLLYKEDGRA